MRIIPFIVQRKTILNILERHQAELKINLEGIGGCDHDVGHCVCDVYGLLSDTQSLIDVLTTGKHHYYHSDYSALKGKVILERYVSEEMI